MRLTNLRSQSASGNGTNRLGGIVCQVELMVIGKGLQLVQDLRGKEVRGRNGRVVDLRDVNVVVD